MSKPSVESLFGGADADSSESLSGLAEKVLSARAKADAAKASYEISRDEADRLERLCIDKMEEVGLKSIRLDAGATFTAAERKVFQLPKTDDEKNVVFKWLRRVGGASLVKEAVNYQTLNAFCRERLEDGKQLNSLLKETSLKYLSIRKS